MKLGPGLTFSWKRALGVTAMRQRAARRSGIPTTRNGAALKLGRAIIGGAGCLTWIAALALLLLKLFGG